MKARPGIAFRKSGSRSSWAAPSARMVALEIQDRRDHAAVRRKRSGRPVRSRADRELVEAADGRSRQWAEARVWCRRVGFSEDELGRAVSAALFLRALKGPGNVTGADVRGVLEEGQ